MEFSEGLEGGRGGQTRDLLFEGNGYSLEHPVTQNKFKL